MIIELGPLRLGWREIVLAVVVMLGLYMVFVAWMMRRLRRQALPPKTQLEPSASVKAAGAAAYAANAEADDVTEADREDLSNIPRESSDDDRHELPSAEVPDEGLAASALHAEVRQMRHELDSLRAEFAALRAQMQHEAAQIKATQSISPLYSDAMQMAAAGNTAETIAERCGISRAEAELVVALVRSQA